MTESFEELDRRARVAAADLHDRAASEPVPDFDPDRPMMLSAVPTSTEGSRTRAVFAVAAVLALIAGVAAVVVFAARKDSPDTIVAGPQAEVPPYVLDPVPDGFEGARWDVDANGATSELSSEMGAESGVLDGPVELYGPEDGRAVVGVIVDSSPSAKEWLEEGDDVGDPVDLGGRDGFWEPEESSFMGARALSVIVDESVIGVMGSAEPQVMEAIGARVDVEEGKVVLGDGVLPDGWSEKGSLTLAELFGSAGGPGPNMVSYMRQDEPEDSFASIGLSTRRSPDPDIDVSGLFPDMSVGEYSVGDAPARAMFNAAPPGDDGAMVQLSWSPEPGVTADLFVIGSDVDVDRAIAYAETARPATDEEWDALGGSGALDRFDEMESEDVEGEFPSGVRWMLTASTEAEYPWVSLDVHDGSVDRETFMAYLDEETPGLDDEAAITFLPNGHGYFASLLTDDTARLSIERPGEAPVDAELVELGIGRAAVADLGDTMADVVRWGADGSEIGRISLDLVAQFDGAVPKTLAEGEIDGHVWTLVATNGDVLLEVDDMNMSGTSSDPDLGAVFEARGDDAWLIAGLLGDVPAGTIASAEVEAAGPAPVVEVVDAVDGSRFWIASVDPAQDEAMVVLLDAGGAKVGSVPFTSDGAGPP